MLLYSLMSPTRFRAQGGPNNVDAADIFSASSVGNAELSHVCPNLEHVDAHDVSPLNISDPRAQTVLVELTTPSPNGGGGEGGILQEHDLLTEG